MPIMRPQIVNYLILAFVVLCNLPMHAQLAAGSEGNVPPPPARSPDPPDGPIDNGILFLIIIAIVYGVSLAFHQMRVKRNRA